MNRSGRTTQSQPKGAAQPTGKEPREAALSQVKQDTAGQQERVHRQAAREGQEDTRTQAEKFADAAREHGADDSEDVFKGVLRKLAKPRD